MPKLPTHANTYVAGEGDNRLQRTAAELGLKSRRPVRLPVRFFQLFSESIAAQMHSVGALSEHERLDPTGHLQHYVSVRKRRSNKQSKASKSSAASDYGTLSNLFEKPIDSATVGDDPSHMPATVVTPDGDEEEDVIVVAAGGSLSAAIFGIIKGTVGPAILYLPHGFQSSGYAVAVPAMLFATLVFIYSATILLECWAVERQKNLDMAARVREVLALIPNDSAEASKATGYQPRLLTYPELARRALGKYSAITTLGIALFQYGVCLTYLIFVPQNLFECTKQITGISVPINYFLWGMVLGEVPLAWIADIRRLTPTNVLATLLIAYGLLAVLLLALSLGLKETREGGEDYETVTLALISNLKELPAMTSSWFLFIGTSFFMMEGSITLVVPLQEAVSAPEDQKRFPYINGITTFWIVMFYITFSVWCIAGFGAGLRTALTASLQGTVATTVQLAYSVAVFFTFPLQAFPATQVTCKALLGENPLPWHRSLLASFITLLLGVIAVTAMDYLGNVVSILGSLFGIPLALVFPPLMHNALVVKDSTQYAWRRWLNYAVVGVGLFAMGAASYATMVSWDEGAE